MKFRYLIIVGFFGSALAYTQSDLLSAQYNYQSTSDQLTLAKSAKQDASKALSKAQKNYDAEQTKFQQAQVDLKNAQKQFADSESNLLQKTTQFKSANDKLNQVWNGLNTN